MVKDYEPNTIFNNYFENLETEEEFDLAILEKNNLTIDDFFKEEKPEPKLGWINKKIWYVRNWTSSRNLKDLLDAYLVGGMTQEEQQIYLPVVNKDPIKLSRYSSYIDFGLTVGMSVFPYLTDIVLQKNTNYEGNAGLITALTAISQSFGIATFRIAYTYIKKKPIESFSLLSIAGNSTTYFKKKDKLIDKLIELLKYNCLGYFDKIWGYEHLKEINKID
jgi:hypothetical protein